MSEDSDVFYLADAIGGSTPNCGIISSFEVFDDVSSKAERILKEENPIKFIIDTFHSIHVGDDVLSHFLLATIGCQLCTNTYGLHPGLTGESGKGKSYACRAMYHLLPKEYKTNGSHSNKSFFHMDLRVGTVIFLDDIEGLNDDLERMIKVSTSQYQEPYSHYYTDINSPDKKVKGVSLSERSCWWITSVNSSFDIQVLNRYLTLSMDETEVQDQAVARRQIEQAKTGSYGFDETEEVFICRCIIRILKDSVPVRVKIPYADFIEWRNFENRRNLPMFLDTIMSFTALNQFQRKKDSNGVYLANLEDYDSAKMIWNHVAKGQVSKLSPKEMVILQLIRNAGSEGIPRSDLLSKTKIPSGSLSKLVRGVKQRDGTYDGGLLNKIQGLIEEDVLELDINMERRRHTKRYFFKGDIPAWENFESIVSIRDRDAAQLAIDSCDTE